MANKIRLKHRGVLQIARIVCELDPNADEDTVSAHLMMQFGVRIDQFKLIAERLIPLSIPASSPLVQTIYHGFNHAAVILPEGETE